MSQTNSHGLREEKDKKWEQVQIKAFTMWINTYLEPLGFKIGDVAEDFKSGVNLCVFLEEVSKKKLTKWSKKPAMRVHKIENLSIALNFMQKDLGVRLVSIGPEDIADGNIKLTLGVLWSLFRRLRIEVISEGEQSSEMGLLAWIKKMTDGYLGVDIKNFKESFCDGLAFSALINAMDPEALNYDAVDHNNREKTLAEAFEIAEKKLGVPKLLDVDDLTPGNVDERAVILYSSMYFHAYIADEEKRKLVEQKKSIAEQIAELRTSLERERLQKERLKRLNKQREIDWLREQSNKDALIAKLREKIRKLIEEINFLKQRVSADADLRSVLETKIKSLQDIVNGVQSELDRVPFSEADLLSWIKNITGEYDGVNVTNFKDSFSDGLAFSAIIHSLDPTAIDFKSLDRTDAKSNVANAISIAENRLGIPPIFSASDLLNGSVSENEIVTYAARFLQRYIEEGGKPILSERDLLNWVNKTAAVYGVKVDDFEKSFNDGLAFSALIAATEPGALSFKDLDPSNAKENLQNALEIAEKKLGIPSVLNSEAMLSGNADGKAVQAYTTQFFQKYVASKVHELDALPKVSRKNNQASRFGKENLLDWLHQMTDGYDHVDVQDFKTSFNNGMAFSALIHKMDPDSLDFGSLNPENALENLTNAFNIAQKRFGIPQFLDVEDLLNGNVNENDIVAYTSVFYQRYLAESSLFGENADATSLDKYPPKIGLSGNKFSVEDLLQWAINTTKDYDHVEINDFKDSFKDGMAFSALIHAFDPTAIDYDALNPANVQENVRRALDIAEKRFGIPKLIKADDLIKGNAKENDIIQYTGRFFQKYLEDSGLFASAKSRGIHAAKSPENDLLEWSRKVTADYPNVDISNFRNSFNDGLAFSAIIHSIDPEAIDFKSIKPENKKENLVKAFEIAEKRFGIPQILNVDDILSGRADERDIIAYDAKFFQKYVDEVGISDDSKFSKADLLNWVQKMTAGYKNVNVTDFKDSFSDGLALAALINSLDSSAIDFDSLNPEEKLQNLVKVLETAELKFGIPQLLNAEDLLSGAADEKEVSSYLSKFLSKYIAEAGKYPVPGSKTRKQDPYAPENDLLSWAKKLTEGYPNVDIISFKNSFNDGLAFSALVHALNPEAIDFNNLDPANAEQNLENAVRVAQEKLGIPKLINTDDLLAGDADERDIMAYTSKFFQRYVEQIGTQKPEFTEEDLLTWAKKMTEGYDFVNVTDFKNSFSDGMAISALVHAFDPTALDFASLNPKNAKENLLNALAIAEKKFGIPKIADPQALLNGTAKEQDIIGYTANFFRKYVAESGKFNQLATAEASLDRSTEQNITDDGERERLLRELEDRKKRLLQEIASLQQGIKDELLKNKLMQEEIEYLKQKSDADNELRSILEQKVNILQNLVEEGSSQVAALSEKQHKLSAELDQHKKRAEEAASDRSELESFKNQLLTDAEEKARRLRDLEERKKRLMSELSALQQQVQQELDKRNQQLSEIAVLKKMIEGMGSKQIVYAKARLGLDALKRNLEEHLEDLYQWRDLHDIEMKDQVEDFDLTKVISDISSKSFEAQLAYLDGRLQEENRNLSRIIKLKDSKAYLNDVVIKAGWLVMKGKREWVRRWFKLSGDRLSYFEDDTSSEVAGSVQLDQGCDVVRHKASKEEDSNKKVWPLKISVGDRKLFVRAATKKERHAWFAALTSRIAHLNYTKQCEASGERPDTRLLGALNAASTPYIHISDRPVTQNIISALVKGLPGRDELEGISLENADITDDLVLPLFDVFEKLPNIKQFYFSKNKLTSGIVQRFVTVIKPDTVTDINVSDNQLNDEFLEVTSAALAKNANLNTFVLSGNKFTAAGVKALATNWTAEGAVARLQDLFLANNQLGDGGASALKPLFAKTEFKKVDLSGNAIGDAGVTALAEALTNSKVEELNLSNNQIGPAGARALKALMEANDHLHTVKLSGNSTLSANEEAATLFSATGFKFSELSFTRA